MEGFKTALLLLLGLCVCAIPSSYGISESCMKVYNEGGAPAVLQSPQCLNWVQTTPNQNMNCQFATIQGRRKYQEDRVSCNLDMQIPIQEQNGLKVIKLGIVAVFDGHIGKEASEMASKLLLDFFSLHTVFAHEGRSGICKDEHDMSLQELREDEGSSRSNTEFGSCQSVARDKLTLLDILKEALLRTILDIDSSFSKEASENNIPAGSTATVALLVDGQILVANLGDSKAFLCRQKGQSLQFSWFKGYFSAEELTRDHNPGRHDERARIEAAGGFIENVRGPWLNGALPMSRAIGDVWFKRYGLISVPEMTGWRHLTANDSYLVVSSDGIFESLTPLDACELLTPNLSSASPCASSSSLAECIVNTAYKRGSTDNLSVIVVPL